MTQLSVHAVDAPSLFEEAKHELERNPALAGERLRTCMEVADAVGDRATWARAAYLLARVAVIDGRPDDALELIDAAREAWIGLHRTVEACRTNLGRMNVLDELGRHAEAVTAGDRLLRDLEVLERDDEGADDEEIQWLCAAASENIGAALGSMGQHQRAIAAAQTAEVAYERLGSVGDVARVRANRGIELIEMGSSAEGVLVLNDAAGLFATEGDDLSHAMCLAKKGEGETALGQHSVALATLETARTTLERIGARVELARVCVTLASLYLELNLLEEAYLLASKARESFSEMGLIHDCAFATWHVEECAMRAGRAAEAVAASYRAVDAFNEVGDAAMAARAELTLSEALLALGDRESARRRALAVVATLRLSERPGLLAVAILWLALLMEDEQRRCEALLDEASRLASELRLPELDFLVAHRLGCLRVAQGRPDEARGHLRDAVRIADSMHSAIRQSSLRTGFLLRRAKAHNDLIRLLLDSGEPEDVAAAFWVSEGRKTSGLVRPPSSGTDPNSDPNDANDATDAHAMVAERIRELHAAYDAMIASDARDADERHRLNARIEVLEREISLARLRVADASGGHSRDVALDPAGIQHRLAISYHVLDDEVLAFVWSHGELSVWRNLCSTDHLRGLLHDLATHWGRERLATTVGLAGEVALVHAARGTLGQLYSVLLAPLMPMLQPETADLVIAPDGALSGVPFHALFNGTDYLDEQRSICVVSALGASGSKRPPSAEWPALFTSPIASLVLGTSDPTIPGAGAEAEAVGGLLGVDAVVGAEATFALFADRAPQSRIVHLAGHGIHRSSRPGFSGLRLADRWLSPFDLHSIDLRGVLAVLSACETGLHVSRGIGDDPTGLARGFLAAGASAVVVTLWPVSDRATEVFMRQFYELLVEGARPTRALRRARSIVAGEFPHPYYWAPFTLLGNGF